ncbi:MAG: hypothetical protein ACRC9F_00665 [Metamycoplasmataceae bacterium]
MAYETTQSLDLERDKEYITQNKDILTKKIRWDNYLKGFSYFLYSLFVALLSLTFLFTGARDLGNNNFQYLDLVNVFIGLFALLISAGIISWVYKGSLKKLFTINYYVVHLFNGLILSIIAIIISLPMFEYPINGTIQEINNATQMQTLTFGIGMLVWFIIGVVVLTLHIQKLKGTFPTSWLKWKLSLVTLLIFPVLAMISWAASLMPEMKTVLLIVQLCVFVVGSLYTMFSFAYVKSFKELILSDKTEKEIQKIEYFRNISFLMILAPSLTLVILGIVKATPLLTVWSSSTLEILSIVSIIFDALILIAYLLLIISLKKKGNKTKLLSSIDNAILMDLITWFLLVKTIVIVGFSKGVEISVFMSLSSCFLAIFIINITNIVIGVNFPNIRNTSSTIINIVASMAILGMALFQSTFTPESSTNIFEGAEIVILTMLPVLIASSINLGIKILGFVKMNSFKKTIFNKKDEMNVNKDWEQKPQVEENKAMGTNEKNSKVGA